MRKVKNIKYKLLLLFLFACILSIPRGSYSQDFWYWQAIGKSEFSKEIHSVEIYNNDIFIGGKFDKIKVNGIWENIRGIAKWNGSRWIDMGGESQAIVYSMVVWNGSLIAAGKFNTMMGVPALNIALWNGTTWQNLGSGLNGDVNCIMVTSTGDLVAGGKFNKSGSSNILKVAKWTGSSWVQLGNGLDNDVNYLTEYNGELVAGGKFDGKVQRYNGNQWSILGNGLSNDVYTLAIYNGNLIAGGKFDNHISFLNTNQWQTFGNGVNDDVFTLCTFDDYLIAGGKFMTAGEESDNNYYNRVVKWKNGWNKLATGMNGQLNYIKSFDSLAIAVGNFSSAGGDTAYNIAKWKILPTRTIEGTVRYSDNNLPVEGGKVYAAMLDIYTKEVLYLDTAEIVNQGLNIGKYVLTKVPVGLGDLLITYPNDEDEDNPIIFPKFVPSYFPGEILWRSAIRIPREGNLTNMDISVNRTLEFALFNNSIFGKAKLKFTPQGYPPGPGFYYKAGTNIFLKNNLHFYSYDVTDKYENFRIDSIPPGIYTVIADRLGYGEVYVQLNLTASSIGDSVIIEMDTISIVTAILNGNGNTVPATFKLYQNYPNPFNPTSTIKFDIANDSQVKLKIYDITGREIVTLFNSSLTAGTYEAQWNASRYSSGIYYYTLETEGFRDTKKMVLIK